MKFLIAFIIVILFSCSSKQNKSTAHIDSIRNSTKIETTNTSEKLDSNAEDQSQADARKELILSYEKPIFIDTFFIDKGKKVEIVFNYLCTKDSSIKVPAKYDFDTNKDFITHDFISELTVISGGDTAFKKRITRSTFDDLLDESLRKYATLYYPSFHVEGDSIKITYSISIPVTDVGVGAFIKFAKDGNYVIGQ
ncbi:MAG TPA: hypothetical protein VG890_01620 [Puia sp.]|nr:hypothetical protein [Puia sp.]